MTAPFRKRNNVIWFTLALLTAALGCWVATIDKVNGPIPSLLDAFGLLCFGFAALLGFKGKAAIVLIIFFVLACVSSAVLSFCRNHEWNGLVSISICIFLLVMGAWENRKRPEIPED